MASSLPNTARKEQKTAKLISLIAERQRADVAELAADLGVSQVTIRKDLDELEKKALSAENTDLPILMTPIMWRED